MKGQILQPESPEHTSLQDQVPLWGFQVPTANILRNFRFRAKLP